MEGSVLYTDTSVDSTANEVSINSHTSAIYFWNNSSSTNATVRLNGKHDIVIPKDAGFYHEIKGDYTKFQVITASVTLSVYAIG